MLHVEGGILPWTGNCLNFWWLDWYLTDVRTDYFLDVSDSGWLSLVKVCESFLEVLRAIEFVPFFIGSLRDAFLNWIWNKCLASYLIQGFFWNHIRRGDLLSLDFGKGKWFCYPFFGTKNGLTLCIHIFIFSYVLFNFMKWLSEREVVVASTGILGSYPGVCFFWVPIIFV